MKKWIMDFEGDLVNLDKMDSIYISIRKGAYHVIAQSKYTESSIGIFPTELDAKMAIDKLYKLLDS